MDSKGTCCARPPNASQNMNSARIMQDSRADTARGGYFPGFASAGTSTLSICNSIWVPESSFTFSVFDTITGPGVLALGVVIRLRPLSPKTPCGVPTLIGLPLEATSSSALELSACVEGDCFTVMGAWYVASDSLAAPPPVVRLDADVFVPRPVGAAGGFRATPIIEGGSICEGSSTRDLLITGWARA